MNRAVAFAAALTVLLTASVGATQRALMASPTCEELTIMDFLARLDEEPGRRYKRGLDKEDRRDLSQLRREVCAPYVGYRVTRQPTTTWSNGRAIVRNFLELNHPNGQVAKRRSGEWFYPSGARARTALGEWRYPDGTIARSRGGEWFTREGRYVDDADEVEAEACDYLGKELCPFGNPDEDLLAVTVIGLLNKTAPPRAQPPAEVSTPDDKKDE